MNQSNLPYGYPNAGDGFSYTGSARQGYASVPLPSAAAAAAYAASSSLAYADAPYAESSDDEMMPWEERNWVPTSKSGKQKTPNMIRNELQRYIDSCMADGSSNQTRIIERMGVNSNSFRKFMDPKTYKDQWSATQNGTYWAAGKLLAQVAYEKELAKKSGSGKRKSAAAGTGSSTKKAKTTGEAAPRKKTSAELKLEALELIQRINAVQGVMEGVVYDSCPQVVKKIKDFLQREGMTKANLLLALGDINSNSLNKFLSGKKQDQCGNVAYRSAYVFFEKCRILERKSKSAARLKNEREHPHGFSLEKARPARYVKWLPPAFGAGHSAW